KEPAAGHSCPAAVVPKSTCERMSRSTSGTSEPIKRTKEELIRKAEPAQSVFVAKKKHLVQSDRGKGESHEENDWHSARRCASRWLAGRAASRSPPGFARSCAAEGGTAKVHAAAGRHSRNARQGAADA